MSGKAHQRNRRRRKKWRRRAAASEKKRAAKTFAALAGRGGVTPRWIGGLELATGAQLDDLGARFGLRRQVDHFPMDFSENRERQWREQHEDDASFRDRVRATAKHEAGR